MLVTDDPLPGLIGFTTIGGTTAACVVEVEGRFVVVVVGLGRVVGLVVD